jgi:hypothetical protein
MRDLLSNQDGLFSRGLPSIHLVKALSSEWQSAAVNPLRRPVSVDSLG